MIGQLTGQIVWARERKIILAVAGVGYKISLTADGFAQAQNRKGDLTLWTHLAVREDALDLYGFAQREELEFFELLLTTPGIGPKSALTILSLATPKTIEQAVLAGDTSHLTQISGIGKKSAEKIIMTLKDKLKDRGQELREGGSAELKADIDALEALRSLGYKTDEARGALRSLPTDLAQSSASDKVKAALRKLNA